MLEPDLTLAAMAEALAKSTDYRVLRRLVPRTTFSSSIGQSTKTGILLDVETTGLDQRKDEVIELGMVKFDYLPDGRIARVRDVFSSFNEPSEPIPSEITALTGITNDMVAEQRIDEAAVSSFAEDAVIVIAHNASFDRKFAERYWPIFQRKAWGCSAAEVEWRKHGFEGSRLGYLLNGAGFFHQAHRAIDDCHALLRFSRSNCRLPAHRRLPSCSSRLGRGRCGCGRNNRLSTLRTCLNGEATGGATAATVAQSRGTSTSTRVSWMMKSRFSRARSISRTLNPASRS
jgi:DNA polymerase-3 subunit epsilon